MLRGPFIPDSIAGAERPSHIHTHFDTHRSPYQRAYPHPHDRAHQIGRAASRAPISPF